MSMQPGVQGGNRDAPGRSVAKRRQSVYRPGMRSRDWVKIPIRHRDEFVVGGYLAPSPDHLSTLIVGQFDRAGKLRYAGLVGTGLSGETRRVILRELLATGRKTSPFVPAPALRDHFGELRTDLPAPVGPALDRHRRRVQAAHPRRFASCGAAGDPARQEGARG